MKGKIDEHGNLVICRRGSERWQGCMYDKRVPCADHCPHFSEPTMVAGMNGEFAKIEICHEKTLYFEEFTDERPVKDE